MNLVKVESVKTHVPKLNNVHDLVHLNDMSAGFLVEPESTNG